MPFNVNDIDFGILVDNMPDLIFYLDMDKKLLSFNAGGNRFLKMIGSTNPLPGDDVLAFFPEKKRNHLRQELDKLNKGEVFSFKDIYLDNQNAFYFDISLYALSGVKGEQIGFCMLLRDTTDKRQVEELERKLKDERNARHQQLTEAIISAQETERAEIGRELHDNVNQILGLSRLYLDLAKQSSESQKSELINKSSDHILDAIEEIRKLSKSLVSPLQRLLTLESAVSSLAEDLMMVHNFLIKIVVEGFETANLNDKFKLNIFRIVQEQLNNIIKHAHSNNITIVLSSTDRGIRIEITDDGQGFDTSLQRKGIGLSNIQSRTELYNGTMEVVSSPGEGCRLMIHFPWNESTS